MYHGGRAWLSDPDDPNYLAGRKATKHVYGVDPDLTREGGSIPVTLTLQVELLYLVSLLCPQSLYFNSQLVFVSLLQEMTGKSVILLPVGAGDDGAHSQNEKIDIRNYIEGVMILLLNFYLLSVALLQHT